MVAMATTGAGLHTTRASAWTPYVVEKTIDLSKAGTIAQGTVIEAIAVPAASIVTYAGFQVLEPMTGSSTDTTLDFGITGGNVDEYVDGFDLDAAAAGAYATPASTAWDSKWFGTADTLDLLVVTQTGTVTGGKLRVFAVITPVEKMNTTAGIAQVGS